MKWKANGLTYALLLNFSLICWIVFAFIDIKMWLAALIGIGVAVIFCYYCKKEYQYAFFSVGYLISAFVAYVACSYMSIVWWRTLLCCFLMTCIYPIFSIMWQMLKEAKEEDKKKIK